MHIKSFSSPEELTEYLASGELNYPGVLTVGEDVTWISDNTENLEIPGTLETIGNSRLSPGVNDGKAGIREIRGKSVIQNQLVQNGDLSDGLTGWESYHSQISVPSGALKIVKNLLSGGTGGMSYQVPSIDTTHNYYISGDFRSEDGVTPINFGFHSSSMTVSGNTMLTTSSTSFTHLSGIVKPVNNSDRIVVRVGDSTSADGVTGYAKNIMLIDLTRMFGPGSEPTAPEEVFTKSYYPYNLGELTSLGSGDLITTGGGKSRSLTLPINTITSAGDKIFPDGMKSAGVIYDELISEDGRWITKATKRVGVIDLGSLSWTRTIGEDISYFRSINNPFKAASVNYLCARYSVKSTVSVSANLADKQIAGSEYAGYLYIRDDSYSDAASLKSSLSGVLLYYELTTPVSYILDNPIPAGFTSFSGGTEEYSGNLPLTTQIVYPDQARIYGVTWSGSSPTCTRIGRADLHASLPVHRKLRRCLLLDSGKVNYYLDANDSTRKSDGSPAVLDGTDGNVMVEIPTHWRKTGANQVLLSDTYQPGFEKIPKMYVSAYEAAVDRTDLQLMSIANTSTRYRGGNNNSGFDGTDHTLLGRPATGISLTNFRAYARKNRDTRWNCNTYEVQKALYWLFVVEYATLNSQAAYNPALTAQGYRQGGLGLGVSNLDGTKWNAWNSYNPFIPCGYTNSLGNRTGIIDFVMPAGYGTPLTTSVPSYRGIENPFGHIYKWADGCLCNIQSNSDGGKSEFFICESPENYSSSIMDNYEKRGELPRSSGYVKQLIPGEIMPSEIGGGGTTYFCDYYYMNIPASGATTRGVFFGGAAYSGTYAGFVFSYIYNAPSYTSTYLGSRLCFIP